MGHMFLSNYSMTLLRYECQLWGLLVASKYINNMNGCKVFHCRPLLKYFIVANWYIIMSNSIMSAANSTDISTSVDEYILIEATVVIECD